MFKRALSAALLATSCIASSAEAQSTCTPEKLNGAIDAYANDPFGARAWRKLNGLGDLENVSEGYTFNSYEESNKWRALIEGIAPGNAVLANPNYECRLGYPLEVLQARVAKYGKTSDYVQQWLRGQEVVFTSCARDATATQTILQMPSNLKPDEQALMQHDVAYQQASLAFYGNPTSAIALYKAIAVSNSPHRAAARYNVANLLANAKNITEARREAKSILADVSVSSVHGITRELLGYIANLEDTPQGWTELIDGRVAILNLPLTKISGDAKVELEYSKAVYDIGYAGVTAKKDDWWVTNTLPADATLSKSLADAARKHPMIMWMMAGQSVNKPYTLAPWSMVGEQWQNWSTSYVDRAMALQTASLPPLPKLALESLKANPDDASRASLWTAAVDAASKAQASCGDASETGYLSLLALQAVRLSAMAGRYDEIYEQLPKLKLEGTVSLRDVILPKLMQHILASGQVEEGRRLRDALLTDAFFAEFKNPDEHYKRNSYAEFLSWVAEDQAHWLKAVALLSDKLSPVALNLLPTKMLQEFGDNVDFTAEQRGLLKRAAWTRNFARGIANTDKITTEMLTANPNLATALQATETQYPKLPPDRALLLTILRNPRFGILVNSPDWSDPIESKREKYDALDAIDPNDKNWWCPLETDRQLGALRLDYDNASGISGPRSDYGNVLKPVLASNALDLADAAREKVLKQHPMIKSVNWKEVAGLAKAPSAPKLLALAAMRWGKAAKSDDGAAAEALALAVRSTRYGCRWHGSHKSYSKPAQEMLKAKFGKTTWAEQTPYWFDCTDLQFDANYNKVTSCKPRSWKAQALPK